MAIILDDLAARQRNRQLLADTAQLGVLLERIKTAYHDATTTTTSQAKLVTFSPSTISMSGKEMSQSIDNLNTPLPPEMSTVLQSDTVAATKTPTPPPPVVKEEPPVEAVVLSPRQELMAKAETLFSQTSSSEEDEETESVKPPPSHHSSLKSEPKQRNSVKSEPKSTTFNDALENVALHSEPSNHNFAEPERALFSSKRTTSASAAQSKRSSQRTTIESATSERATTPLSHNHDISRKSTQSSHHSSKQQQQRKSASSEAPSQRRSKSKSFQLLESPRTRRMSQATTTERIMSDDSVSETTMSLNASKSQKTSKSKRSTHNDEDEDTIDEKLWYQNDVASKSPQKSKFASSWNALDNDDDSFSFD